MRVRGREGGGKRIQKGGKRRENDEKAKGKSCSGEVAEKGY